MSGAVRFVIAIFLFDIVSIVFLRQRLKDYLEGSCSKTGVRNIREKLSMKDRIKLNYIEPYIRDEKEKRSFRRHYLFYQFKCVAAPVLFAAVLLCLGTGNGWTKYIVFLYAGYVLIPQLIIGIFEYDPIQKCTVHAMKKHSFNQGKKRNRKTVKDKSSG